jgi:DNA segregation ATPase FtsK/SpoIIIE, S-DNA-T family
MSRVPNPSKNDSSEKANGGISPEPEPANEWLDGLAEFWLRFGKFGRDVLGVSLLAAALLTLLGMFQITQGVFITPWVNFLGRWLGWGGVLVPLILAIAGFLALWRHFEIAPRMRLSRILALEGAAFILLALFTVVGGVSLDRARAGLDGGLIGWGLATLLAGFLPAPWSTILLVLLLGLFLFSGLGIFSRLADWVERQAEKEESSFNPVIPQPAESERELDATADEDEDLLPLPPLNENSKPAEKPGEKNANGIKRDKRLPPLNLLMKEQAEPPDRQQIHSTAARLENTLAEFGIPARVRGYRIGPTVTQYAVEPGFVEKTGPDGEVVRQKVRVSQISGLARDLALALSAERLRIEAPVPGQSFVGVEVPNPHSTIVRLRPILESNQLQKLNSPLAIVLGQDVSGQPVIADLARMPHMLIAGTTGSGKSVCIAALTTCLVANNTPDELKLAMLDPKMVELVRFNGLPHLLGKVETQLERMLGVLRWALQEMDTRYRLLEKAKTLDLETYNRKMERRNQPGLPRIVLLVDELADLMMSSPDQTEHNLVRLAQMARATGIHLVVATQRPSTDVVTGLIKANFPARISFTVASSVDSRVILDTSGAETLLGHGDMLFLNPESGTPQRAQGVMVTDQEVDRVVTFWKKMAPQPEDQPAPWEELVGEGEEGSDSLIEQATKIVRQTQHASASLLQRRLRVGYPRAARLIDELEEAGVVGPGQGGGKEREVLLPREDVEEDDGDDRESYNDRYD